MLTEEQAQKMTTGELRRRCERLANNDDELLELISRGYQIAWSRDGKLTLLLDGAVTHGPFPG